MRPKIFPTRPFWRARPLALPLAVAALFAGVAAASAQSSGAATEDLARKAQNPVADMISVPFQNNTNMLQGPYGETGNVLNVEPVIPIKLSEDWNLITRTILPIVSQVRTSPTEGPAFGLGDVNPTLFLSPAKPGEFIWGVGPSFSFPTAGADVLGTGKWEAGPSAVGLFIKGPWVVGAVVNNLWSFAGPGDRSSVSMMTAQYFINYNFPEG
ncbi:hypothetical protein [Methylocella sp.]|uniref:hypothetical protein n=1 Tax=Methylocella sp. TaxID=1978226 RepID=UPI003782D4B8